MIKQLGILKGRRGARMAQLSVCVLGLLLAGLISTSCARDADVQAQSTPKGKSGLGKDKTPANAKSKDSAVASEVVEYKHGEQVLEGYLAKPEGEVEGKLPAILVVHNWMGLTQLTKDRCEELARHGYVAFAADIYGKGVRPANAQEAGQQAGKYRSDRGLLRARAQAALDYVSGLELVDANKIVAIGFCFGGGTVLELARSGADVAGVVSFHGNLDTPDVEDAANITCKVLVQHGADDPYVPMEQVTDLHAEMSAHGVDYQVVLYGGAVHSFTNPGAGDDKSRGAAYHERTANRAWKLAHSFFAECFEQ